MNQSIQNKQTIFVSSACVQSTRIRESLATLAEAGFREIELTGGTNYYVELERDLLELQDKYELTFQLHNYFPPPEKPFVLNLASTNEEIFRASIELCKKAIKISKMLGGKRYAVHAGFLIDFEPKYAGRKINFSELARREIALMRMTQAWQELEEASNGDILLYVENNVFSETNFNTFRDNNPFLMCDYDGFLELSERIRFNLLLDVAHLKVSANSLGLDYHRELRKLSACSDYFHLSENDGMHDQNRAIEPDDDILKRLQDLSRPGQTYVLEIYQNLELVNASRLRVRKALEMGLGRSGVAESGGG